MQSGRIEWWRDESLRFKEGERQERKGGRLTKVRWCMSNCIQSGESIREMKAGRGRRGAMGKRGWWRRERGKEKGRVATRV